MEEGTLVPKQIEYYKYKEVRLSFRVTNYKNRASTSEGIEENKGFTEQWNYLSNRNTYGWPF